MSFADLGLNPLLVRNLRAMGYRQPWPVQAAAIEPIIAGRDVVGLAKTGTGKTAAYAAPIAHQLIENPPPRPGRKPIEPMSRLRALVLCPTRELAVQVADEAGRICQGTVLRTACAYGKVGLKPQAEAIARGVDMLIATPGRVRELLDAGAMSLAHIRHIAIDEADRMMDMGFLPQVSAILERIPTPRQTLFFTATMPEEIQQLGMRFLDDPVHIEVDPHTRPVEHVKQHVVPVEEADKVPLLLHMLEHGYDKGVLIFCRTRRRVGWVGTALQRNGLAASMIHGDRTQAQRQRALDRFAAGELQVVVATDVAARGLHIPAARTVINYDLPLAAEEYVHRIGRAAHGLALRGGASAASGMGGEAFTFLPARDEERWKHISRTVGIKLKPQLIEGFEPTVPVSPRLRRKAETKRASEGDTPSGRRKRPAKKKQSRPIRKGEQPGRGVQRPGS